MLKNYFRTAFRSMLRSKLFTSINVVGLAISMSVGLLMITFISDLFSYDDFHENKDRMYRVITDNQEENGHVMTLASTSVKAGQKIRETVSGIEELTLIRRGFGGDAKVGKNTIPLEALWADNSFLKIFTFPLIKGNLASALKEPYSLVLTEKSADKLFGKSEVIGKTVKFDSLNYTVTGVLKDVPKLSHLQFEALVSFSTVELEKTRHDGDFMGWGTFFDNYIYLTLPEGQNIKEVQSRIDQLCAKENAALKNQKISLSLQPLKKIAISNSIVNDIAFTVNKIAIWVLIALTCIVLLSACFNYTNLSIARAMKRAREVGIRKVIGAQKRQVVLQFIIESILVSLVSLAFSLVLFLFLREQLSSLHPFVNQLVSLEISIESIFGFVVLAIIVGLIAGILPALFFSKTRALQVLKGDSSLKLFQRVNLRKSLIVIQYVFSLIFITTTIIGYKQYKNFVSYDLGFSTENILNIRLQGNKAELVINELSVIPAITDISQSMIITSLGNIYGAQMKYKDPNDSIMVRQNMVDEKYLSMHEHEFLAGDNFRRKSENAFETEVIVNQKLLKHFNIGGNDPTKAIGEVLNIDGKELSIIGVLKDFHYEKPEQTIEPVAIRYSADPSNYINAKVTTNDWPATLASIQKAWKDIDDVHPLDAKFYDDQIEVSYSGFSMMLKVIGFLSFLAICISSLGLFGMVVFTTETKLKEISIRKVLGAGERSLVYLLSKSFLILLIFSACIALPTTYLLFDKVILPNFAHHQSIGFSELGIGFLGVLIIAFLMIGSQTFKAASTNPAKVLRNE